MIKLREEILEDIRGLADEKYKEFHSGLCPETDNILGVRVPVLRKYAKQLSDFCWERNYRNIGNEYYEETLLKGMILGYAKTDIENRLNYIENFVPLIDNWAVCDITCAGFKFIKKNQNTMLKFITPYFSSNKEFETRFGIVILLDYYLTDMYIDDAINILDNIKNTNYYYVKMAIAWAISIAYIKYPEKLGLYLKDGNNHLDDDTYNKALQKIIESNRINKIEKNKIRKMKRIIRRD